MTNSGPAQINVTPMIDVLLVLLIIFMVILPTKSVGLDSRVPQQTDQSTPAPTPPSTIVIYVKGEGVLEVNHQPVMLSELGNRLLSVFHRRPESTVFITGNPQIEYRQVAQVIDACKGAGIGNVGLLPKDTKP